MQTASAHITRGLSCILRYWKAVCRLTVTGSELPLTVTACFMAGSPQAYDSASYSGSSSRENVVNEQSIGSCLLPGCKVQRRISRRCGWLACSLVGSHSCRICIERQAYTSNYEIHGKSMAFDSSASFVFATKGASLRHKTRTVFRYLKRLRSAGGA